MPSMQRRPGWSHFDEDRWELYHTEEDRSECHDLADQHPELLEELMELWFYEAGKYYGLPLEDRSALEVLTTPRPQMTAPRDRYIYYPNTLEVPEAVAVNVRAGRSRSPPRSTSDRGCEWCHVRPRQRVRRSRPLRERRQAQVRLQLPRGEGADGHLRQPIPTGKCVLGVEFTKESQTPACTSGTFALFIDDNQVGELPMPCCRSASSRSAAKG